MENYLFFQNKIIFFLLVTTSLYSFSYPITSSIDSSESPSRSDHVSNLLRWLQSTPNGFFHFNLEILRVDPENPDSRYGIFSNENIESEEILMTIPSSIIISDEGTNADYEGMALNCGTVSNLIHEMRLGDNSKYAPYINYLIETQPMGFLPSAWSEAGKDFLMELLGRTEEVVDRRKDDQEFQRLPPLYAFGWLTDDWYQECNGSDDPLEKHAALLVVARAWDALLLPVYDMMSHRNGHWLNTKIDGSVHDGHDIYVYASREIKAGEEIYTTYNLCEDCGARHKNYGTPEILRDYGFVEQYPQRWIFEDIHVAFEIDEDEVGSGNYHITNWFDENGKEDMQALEVEYKRLVDIGENIINEQYENIPEHEWDIIVEYHDSITFAMEIALRQFHEETDGTCLEDDTCMVKLNRYVNLEIETEGLDYTSTCDISKVFEPFEDGTYEVIENLKSPYQEIITFRHPGNRDTCFELDNVVQICTSYRPHYHESVVHYTAKFLRNIKRVLWVGGGDSMLLHEIVKYPSLELVVGLELDQTVTRNSFKHFGTQPHYDNEKVQWWYGDAAKSLLMLPRHYFGSFDLVLVDLSETVMSFKVTGNLNIMEALSLLLKPEGIMVKNELYLDQMSALFDYTIMIHWHDNPAICSQALVLGSNHIDFMTREMKDHEAMKNQNLFIQPLEYLDNSTLVHDPLSLIHDYRRNESSVQLHNLKTNTEPEEATNMTKQEQSPGILMIVEAENANPKLITQSIHKIKENFLSILTKENFTIVGTAENNRKINSNYTKTGGIIAITLKEGYIVARIYPEDHYVAFDVHLWGGFGRQETITRLLITSIGSSVSSSSSSFRIIAGGMFGVDSWIQDEMLRGPHFSKTFSFSSNSKKRLSSFHSNKGTNSPVVSLIEQSYILETLIPNVLKESMMFVTPSLTANMTGIHLSRDKHPFVAVLCGNSSEDDIRNTCKSVHTLTNYYQSTAHILPLSCKNIDAVNEYMEDALNQMFACEQHVFQKLQEFLSHESGKSSETMGTVSKRLSAIVVDSGTNSNISKVVHRIFKNTIYREKFLSSEVLVISSSIKDELWRKTFVSLFLEDVFVQEPVFTADIVFTWKNIENDSNITFFTSIAVNGNPSFVRLQQQFMKNLVNTSGLRTEIQIMKGGTFLYHDDFKPTQFFLPDHYNQTSPLEQWKTQKPLGYQTIYQIESSTKTSALTIQMAVESAIVSLPENLTTNSGELVEIHQWNKEVGDGSILVSLWSEGSIIVLWDGRFHIDINIFFYDENVEKSKIIHETLLKNLPTFSTTLRDEQPRGTGRVVNFLKDTTPPSQPHWS